MSMSATTTAEIPNPTPGEIPLLGFIEPMGPIHNSLARAIGVPPRLGRLTRSTAHTARYISGLRRNRCIPCAGLVSRRAQSKRYPGSE
jgi:hypothetical protein